MSAASPNPDRERWTSDAASSNGAASGVRREPIPRLLVLGYITTFAMPPVGLIIGIMLAIRPLKPRSKHGAIIIALSIIAAVVWVLILTSGAFTSTTGENY